jgi:hypothetical protein
VAIPADRNVVQKEVENKLKYVYKMYLCIEIQRMCHWNSNEKLKDKFGICTTKTFDRFTTKDSCSWNITHNTESTAV